MQVNPLFFSFDGIDGCGKSTQAGMFRQWLGEAGHEVVACRDPGSTELGEQIRRILLAHDGPIDLRAEMLLYMAARAQLVQEVILPALDSGKTVVSDRYLLANVVYQGHAGGLGVDDLWRVGQIAVAGVKPVLTFVLDVEPSVAARRLPAPGDRMERRGAAFFERARQGFLDEAARSGGSIVVIDGARGVDEVHREVCKLAGAALRA